MLEKVYYGTAKFYSQLENIRTQQSVVGQVESDFDGYRFL
jgi:hypothetical protein